ncbi:hypothetical protein B0H10DRAFT_2239243 [Mycena sp. CBHHK59/15]|nr:hypothetical protein B0H10DRAFT_2239243 [Mycena sp. CBHHK59/15]
MSNTSKAICAVSQQVDTLIRGLPEPTANDTPQTRNAWIRLLTRLRGTGTVISEQHDFDTNDEDEVEADLTKVNNDEMEGDQNANGNERQGREEDEDETAAASPPADYQYRNFIQNSNPCLNGGFTIITELIRRIMTPQNPPNPAPPPPTDPALLTSYHHHLSPRVQVARRPHTPPPPPPRSTSARRSSTSPVIVLVVLPPSALDLQPDLGPSSLFPTTFERKVDTSRQL